MPEPVAIASSLKYTFSGGWAKNPMILGFSAVKELFALSFGAEFDSLVKRARALEHPKMAQTQHLRHQPQSNP